AAGAQAGVSFVRVPTGGEFASWAAEISVPRWATDETSGAAQDWPLTLPEVAPPLSRDAEVPAQADASATVSAGTILMVKPPGRNRSLRPTNSRRPYFARRQTPVRRAPRRQAGGARVPPQARPAPGRCAAVRPRACSGSGALPARRATSPSRTRTDASPI